MLVINTIKAAHPRTC